MNRLSSLNKRDLIDEQLDEVHDMGRRRKQRKSVLTSENECYDSLRDCIDQKFLHMFCCYKFWDRLPCNSRYLSSPVPLSPLSSSSSSTMSSTMSSGPMMKKPQLSFDFMLSNVDTLIDMINGNELRIREPHPFITKRSILYGAIMYITYLTNLLKDDKENQLPSISYLDSGMSMITPYQINNIYDLPPFPNDNFTNNDINTFSYSLDEHTF
ncbi:hypothetical protein SNEBB_000988 [Seison nebaliae]|nr:hypothetical protein SNEBB_000988 [Seison nebaliae]